MEKDFYCQGEINKRDEYDLFDEIDHSEKRLFTNIVDSVIVDSNLKGFSLSDISCDQNGVYISKRYDIDTPERDETESSISKSLTIHYDRTTRGLLVENYEIIVSYTINQAGVDKLPIVTRYDISFFGENGESTVANVEQLDLSMGLVKNDELSQAYSSRKMTVYDCNQILGELKRLDKVV